MDAHVHGVLWIDFDEYLADGASEKEKQFLKSGLQSIIDEVVNASSFG